MNFRILFWNIWLNNQVQGNKQVSKFLAELKRIIELYQPDFVGLNEVVQTEANRCPPVIEFLKQAGYHYTEFAPAFPIKGKIIGGACVASKYKLDQVQDIVLSNDTHAEKKGFKNHTVKAIYANLQLCSGKNISVIVAHPLLLRLHTCRAHYEGTKKLKKLIQSPENFSNLIIGGDFNESIYWPYSFKHAVKKRLNHRTGSILHPTWSYNAHRVTPFRVNLDQLYWTKNSQLKLNKFQVDRTNISDHRPLIGNFEIN